MSLNRSANSKPGGRWAVQALSAWLLLILLCVGLLLPVASGQSQAPVRMPSQTQTPAPNVTTTQSLRANPDEQSANDIGGAPVEDQATKMNDVPPTPQGRGIYVNDYAGLLSEQDKAMLEQRLQALDDAGVAQESVLILPDTDQELSEFAHIIMNKWDIQHLKKKDGILVLVNANRVRRNLSGNRIYIGVGYAMEGVLNDAKVGRILDQYALPAFSQGDYSGGVARAALMVAQVASGGAIPQSKTQPEPVDDYSGLFLILFILLLFFFIRRMGGGGGFGGGYYGGGWSGGGFGGGGDGGFGGFGGGGGGGFGGGGDSSGGGGAGR